MIDNSNSPGKFAPREFARGMLELGRVPLPLTGKAVTLPGWTKLTVSTVRERFDRLFPPGYSGNVGCLLGEASGGIVDIDLDCVESIRAAEVLLPPTPCRWGRASNPGWSHMAFRVEPCPTKSTSFAAPHGKLLEIRGNRCQTLVHGEYPSSEKRPTRNRRRRFSRRTGPRYAQGTEYGRPAIGCGFVAGPRLGSRAAARSCACTVRLVAETRLAAQRGCAVADRHLSGGKRQRDR
jgi:hypothetical protein